jgi:glucose-1-phosphate cytidylyltransferase
MPILWHVVRIYAAQGFRRFALLTGYLGEMIEEFAAGAVWPRGIEVACVDTGLETPTGGRIAAAAERLAGGTFHVTYADGVSDIDLAALSAFHRSHGRIGTVTVVRPRSQFGIAELDDERVVSFREKPRLDHWVNGGFFCFEPEFLGHLRQGSVLEDAPLARLSAGDQLRAYRHTGFWDCMDTYKDAVMLDDLWSGGTAPWKVWDEDGR